MHTYRIQTGFLILLRAFLLLATFAIALSMSQQSFAQPNNARSLILSDLYSEHYLSTYLTYYTNHDENTTASTLLANPVRIQNISDVSGSVTSLGINAQTSWLGFDVMNRSSQTVWKIDFGSSFMGRFGIFDNVNIYTYNKETQQIQEHELRNDGTVKVTLPVDQRTHILLKLKTQPGTPTMLPLRLMHELKTDVAFNNKILLVTIVLLIGMAFFYGAIAMMKAAHSYLFFSAYYILLTLILTTQNNFVVFPITALGSNIIPLLFLLLSLSALMMARLFWNMRITSRFVSFSLYGLMLLATLCFAGGIFLTFEIPFLRTLLLFGPSLFIFSFIPIVSIIQSQQGNEEATPFMFGWFILLFGICISLLSLSGIMPPVSTAINAYWYTLVPQALFFIVATRMKLDKQMIHLMASKTVELSESDSVSRLKKSKENTEQERLLRVIEQERKVLGELRMSEARRTEEMRKAKEEADVANRAKSAFLAVVSHEIRTPMTGIMGMVRLLLDSNLAKDQKEYAETIQDSCDAMLALLNDILDFEKIEQGKMLFENISFDLHRLVQGVATLMNGHASQKGIELKVNIGDDMPRYVKGDPNRLRQVLLNLTGNAVKFTQEGQVTISAELMKKEPSGVEYEIYFGITDSGIGISEEAQKSLFNPFSQADSSISRKFGGTGLGLAISKGLIEAMGSEININSNEGEGSTFFFTLNMPASQGTEVQQEEKKADLEMQPEKPLQILIVDDNDINIKVIKGFLDKSIHTIETAIEAKEALAKLETAVFDLVLMDIEMPGMKGDEATRAIRKSSNVAIKNIPVIALTGNVMPDDLQQYKDAGMNGHLEKPINPEILETVIANASRGILDNPDMSTTPVQPKPREELTAEIKQPARDTIKDKPKMEEPRTATLDPSTVDIQGMQLDDNENTDAQEISASTAGKPALDETNIVADSHAPQKEEKKEEIAAEEKQLEVETKPITSSAQTTENEIFISETLDTLVSHIEKKDIREMLDDLFRKTDEIIEDLDRAIQQHDIEAIHARGHELKGMTGNFGLVELSKQAHSIESRAKNDPIIVIIGLVAPLSDMRNRAHQALDQWFENIN